MDLDRLTWSPDATAGDWIAGRLGPFGGWVGSVVPRGFVAYARVLHPVGLGRSWAEVCATTGAVPHPLMQWDVISRRWNRSGRTDGEDPREGHLEPQALRWLCETLEPFTASLSCWFALWEGWGWVTGAVSMLGDARAIGPALPSSVIDGPALELPNRRYHLFTGDLFAALHLGWQQPWGEFEPQSPSLIWPDDRSWCVATEIDFDSTLVGGSRAVVDAILGSELEAWEVDPHDSLAANGDTVNMDRT